MDVRNLTDGYTAHLASWLRIKRVNPSVHKSTSSLGAGGAIHQDRQEVHKAFLEIDQDHSGTITLSELKSVLGLQN
eukprot:g22683.t1